MIRWPCLPLLEEGILRFKGEVMLSFILIISDQVIFLPCNEKFNIFKIDVNFTFTKKFLFVNYRKRTQPWLVWCLWRRRRSHLLRQLPGLIPFRVSCSAAWRRGYSTCKYFLYSIFSQDCCKFYPTYWNISRG